MKNHRGMSFEFALIGALFSFLVASCDTKQESRVGKRSSRVADATAETRSVDGPEQPSDPEIVVTTDPKPSVTPTAEPAKIYLADVGVKSFLQINATMSAVTGIPKNRPGIVAEFEKVKSQLPTTNDAASFSGANQGAIAKLAITYCDAAMEDTTVRAALLPGFNFGAASLATAFSPDMKDLVIKSLTDKFWGSDLRLNPEVSATRAILSPLIDTMVAGGLNGQTVAFRTKNILKGLCTAVLASSSVNML